MSDVLGMRDMWTPAHPTILFTGLNSWDVSNIMFEKGTYVKSLSFPWFHVGTMVALPVKGIEEEKEKEEEENIQRSP